MDSSVRILGILGVIMFFRKDPPQTEGRRNADLLIKTPPAFSGASWLLRLIFAPAAGFGQPLQVRCPRVGSHTRKAPACVRSEERAAEL